MKIVFMGTPDFAVPVLEKIINKGYEVSLVVTQPDRPKGRKRELTPPPVKVAAEENNIPVFQPEKIKEDYEAVLSVSPDLIITAAFGQILPKVVLDIPKLGAVNVHASLLPKYRGGAPIHQAIIDGEKETGVTIMYMVEKLDAGDMLLKRAVPISPEDNTGTMHDKLSALGAEMIEEILPAIESGEIHPQAQDEEKVTFARNITKEMEKINWTNTASQVNDQVRGLVPWPVAYTVFDDKRVKVWKTHAVNEHTNQEPGTIIKAEGRDFWIACGSGTILALQQVQPSGKKPMDIPTFLNGQGKNLKPGIRAEVTDE
ncbi:methionyl-tRNA formyltransferase [Alkalicoccus daliensis]|uniref:Methionyl-tRNA formyltransferase n=1 Tax=Alkalicoccus daliensis TaxID=745820 RepID=A0A1G9ZY64_9BACI|nr:methionyl-tRNA formyltransferase [Alkalicoccus daliensis]SDN26250.1 methionyl-tRNA formyltransferase [Alkalicoccus daliensis]